MPTHGSWHSDNLYLDLKRERERGGGREWEKREMTHNYIDDTQWSWDAWSRHVRHLWLYLSDYHLPYKDTPPTSSHTHTHTHTLDTRWVSDILVQLSLNSLLWFCYSLGSSNSIVSLASHLEVCILDTGWTAAGSVRHCRLALPKLLAEEHEHGNSSCLWSILVVEERPREPWSWAYALRQRLSNTRVAMINLCFDYEASRNRSNLLSEGTFVLHYATAAIDDVDVARLTGLTTRGNPRGQRSRISRQNPAQYARARP